MVVGLVGGGDIEGEPPQEWVDHIAGDHGEQAEAFTRHGEVPFVDGRIVRHGLPDGRWTRSTLTFAQRSSLPVSSAFPAGSAKVVVTVSYNCHFSAMVITAADPPLRAVVGIR
ncbi:hypothetical protein O7614_04775 [Micromonospora sp. WMMD961]|uniref:hypothetical protein n=1 Tax=Micromonospora sp. WMMD961 TaxID=3016100 RepID=UPI00241673F5|nr:hypothetical protein [Micromonospora sp. WMMD961]MDG4778958.1 hypothetical protein [Micromonospora sp. WMMD961]